MRKPYSIAYGCIRKNPNYDPNLWPGDVMRYISGMRNHAPATLDQTAVLAVDDHDVNRDFLRLALASKVGRLDFATSGQEAIDRCRERHYDLVLMDLHMPDMDGIEAWRRITMQVDEQIPGRMLAVALTADSRPEVRERVRAAGFRGFLLKPVELPRLLDLLPRLIGGGPDFVDAESAGPSSRLIDPARARRASGSAENARAIQRALIDDLRARRAPLDRMLASGRFDDAAQLLHQWKGASGYAGAGRLETACARLEHLLGDDPESSPGSQYLALLRTLDGTCEAVETADQPPG